MKYRFYKDNKGTVICVSTFARKPVKGIAKCAPNDNYDERVGRALALNRCNVNVSKRRLKKAQQKLKTAEDFAKAANDYLMEQKQYYMSAKMTYDGDVAILEDFIETLK